MAAKKKWEQEAINPEHRGYCTPMSKSTCTPRRKALARRLKKRGDLHHSGPMRRSGMPKKDKHGYY